MNKENQNKNTCDLCNTYRDLLEELLPQGRVTNHLYSFETKEWNVGEWEIWVDKVESLIYYKEGKTNSE